MNFEKIQHLIKIIILSTIGKALHKTLKLMKLPIMHLLIAFINEINLTSAIIDKIEYHFRDNTFHFIFDVSNNFYFYKYIDILYQRGFLYTDRRLKE